MQYLRNGGYPEVVASRQLTRSCLLFQIIVFISGVLIWRAFIYFYLNFSNI